MEQRKMIISNLTIADYKAILNIMNNIEINVPVEVYDENDVCVYRQIAIMETHKRKKLKGEK